MVYLQDKSSIVKTCVMQAFADIAEIDELLRPVSMAKLHALTETGTPAMKARGRKRIARFMDGQGKTVP